MKAHEKQTPNIHFRVTARYLLSAAIEPLRVGVNYLFSVRLPPATAREAEFVVEFREGILRMEASGTACQFWSESRTELRRLIIHDNPRQFLQWPIIRKTMSAICPTYSWRYLLAIRRRPDFNSRFKNLLRRRDHVGRAVCYPFYPWTTADTIQRLYHIHISWESLGIAPSEFQYVCEFGGGYGELCRCFYGTGFNGHYILHDFPELLCLQRYYLSHFGIPFNGTDRQSNSFVTAHTSLEEWEKSTRAATGKGLFVATWSLSEAPVELRDRVRHVVQDKCHAVLIAAQPGIFGYDNVTYFRTWLDPRLFETWIKPVPGFSDGSFYLFARRR